MDEIYTIWEGEYSDADVIGVAYDKEIADAFAKVHHGYVKSVPIITDKTLITRANNMIFHKRYKYINNELQYFYEDYVETDDLTAKVTEGYSCLMVDVYNEKDEIFSRKIASDTLMKYLAEKLENDMLEGNDEV